MVIKARFSNFHQSFELMHLIFDFHIENHLPPPIPLFHSHTSSGFRILSHLRQLYQKLAPSMVPAKMWNPVLLQRAYTGNESHQLFHSFGLSYPEKWQSGYWMFWNYHGKRRQAIYAGFFCRRMWRVDPCAENRIQFEDSTHRTETTLLRQFLNSWSSRCS